MTIISYYNENNELVSIEIDKNEEIGGFAVSEGHLDLNIRIGKHNEPKFIGSNIERFFSLQKAVNYYKKKFEEYEEKSFDWKGHSAGALKFYWDNGETEVLTYLKLNYRGNEIIEFDFNELGF